VRVVRVCVYCVILKKNYHQLSTGVGQSIGIPTQCIRQSVGIIIIYWYKLISMGLTPTAPVCRYKIIPTDSIAKTYYYIYCLIIVVFGLWYSESVQYLKLELTRRCLSLCHSYLEMTHVCVTLLSFTYLTSAFSIDTPYPYYIHIQW
jgi:hypothetical protein